MYKLCYVPVTSCIYPCKIPFSLLNPFMLLFCELGISITTYLHLSLVYKFTMYVVSNVYCIVCICYIMYPYMLVTPCIIYQLCEIPFSFIR